MVVTGNQSRPVILVTDAGRGSAIAIIRSLGRRDWHVIAADSDPRSPGFYSCYAQEQLIYPEPETRPRQLVATLVNAARNRGVDLIIPVSDAVILPLSEARAQFEGTCKLALPAVAALRVTTDKLKTLELAERLGVPTPRTVVVHSVQEAIEKRASLSWPVVLKPQVSRLYRQARIEALSVSYAESDDRLAEEMRRFEGRCPVLLQEYCPGTGEGVELLMYEGRPLAAFQHRRLREFPLSGGPSTFRESVSLDPVLYSYAVRLLETLSWTGLAMVEFKVGERGAKLMEINGRVWGSLPLAVHSKMDFPGHLAELYLCEAPKASSIPALGYTVGVRSRNLELDLFWIVSVLVGQRPYPFLEMPSRREGFLALLGLLNPAYKHDILSWKDARPGLAEIRRMVGSFSTKLHGTREDGTKYR